MDILWGFGYNPVMTVEAGWIGKSRPVSDVIPVFEEAEKRDNANGLNMIRNSDGESYLALAYTTPAGFAHSYHFLDESTTLPDWRHGRTELEMLSNVVMSTMTRAVNRTGHAKLPAVTVRTTPDHTLITGTVGWATECAELLGIPSVKGDTEDIADWVLARELTHLPDTLERIVNIPVWMHMVFSVLEHRSQNATVYLLRSRNKPGWWEDKEPYLYYLPEPNSVTYTSIVHQALANETEKFIALPERSIMKFEIKLS